MDSAFSVFDLREICSEKPTVSWGFFMMCDGSVILGEILLCEKLEHCVKHFYYRGKCDYRKLRRSKRMATVDKNKIEKKKTPTSRDVIDTAYIATSILTHPTPASFSRYPSPDPIALTMWINV
jgi:hypothetical protein